MVTMHTLFSIQMIWNELNRLFTWRRIRDLKLFNVSICLTYLWWEIDTMYRIGSRKSIYIVLVSNLSRSCFIHKHGLHRSRSMLSFKTTSTIVHSRASPMLHLADCSDGQLWEQPMMRLMLSVTDCLPNKPNVAIWLWTQLYQSCPPITKMVIGSINWAQGNRIMSSFYHFAYWKLHTDDKKCLFYRGGGKEGQ